MKNILLILMLLPVTATAKTMYKCSADGVVDYQFRPCQEGRKQEIIEDKPRDEEAAQAGGDYEDGIKLGEFSVKDEETDSIGNHWYAYKVMVTNRTNKEKKVYLTYKAIDSSGFQMDSVNLSGTIPANSYNDLTGRGYMKPDEYSRISKWVVDR